MPNTPHNLLVFERAQRKLQQGPRQGIQADAPGPAAPLTPHAQADGVVGLLTEAYARNAPAGRAPAPWPVSAFSLFGVRGDGGAGWRAAGREEGDLSAAIASARQVGLSPHCPPGPLGPLAPR